MDAIDYVDRKINLLSMHALADAIYTNLEKQKAAHGLSWTHEEMTEGALDVVGRALSLLNQRETRISHSLPHLGDSSPT